MLQALLLHVYHCGVSEVRLAREPKARLAGKACKESALCGTWNDMQACSYRWPSSYKASSQAHMVAATWWLGNAWQ